MGVIIPDSFGVLNSMPGASSAEIRSISHVLWFSSVTRQPMSYQGYAYLNGTLNVIDPIVSIELAG